MATLTVNTTLGDGSVTRAKLNDALVVTEAEGIAANDNDNTIPTSAAVKDYVDANAGGSGDVVGPAGSTNNNVPQWDGNTGDLLKDGLGVSQGGNGAADATKLLQFKSDGGVEASTDLSGGPAVYGETGALGQAAVQGYSTNGGEGGRFQSVGGDGVSGSSDTGASLRGTSGTGPGVHVNVTDAGNTTDLALFHRDDNLGVEIRNNGALDWTTADGASDTRNNVLPSKTGNALKVLRVNGGETDYELADGVTDGSALSIGLQFPNAGLKIADQNADHTLVIVPAENLTADRQLSIRLGDDNRILRLVGNLTATANAEVSGTNTGDQTITLTGDVTGTGTGSFAATIANDAVTYAKMQNVSATDRILGRQSSGAGDVEEITCTAAGRALLDDADANAQRETLGLIRRKITTATTGVSTSYTDVTDLNFSVVAGTTYSFMTTVLAECSSASGGVCLTANGPAATWFAARYEGNQTTGGSIIRSDITAYDTLGSLGDPSTVTAANTPYTFTLQGVIVPSANGTFTLRVKRGGTTGTVAVRAGMIEATAM